MATQTTTKSKMLDAEITPRKMLTVLKTVGSLVDECKIHLNNDGIEICAVDPANVGMVDIDVEQRVFERYRANGDTIGVNVNRFAEMLGLLDKDDPASLEINADNKLKIESNGLDFSLSLIDPAAIRSEPDLPNLDLPAEVVMEARNLNRAIKAADMVSKHITVRVDETERELIFEASGDTDDVELTLGEGDVINLSPGAAESVYSLEYLRDMNTAIPSDAELSMKLGEEFPADISYEQVYEAEGSEAKMDVTFMLAPRIQSD